MAEIIKCITSSLSRSQNELITSTVNVHGGLKDQAKYFLRGI